MIITFPSCKISVQEQDGQDLQVDTLNAESTTLDGESMRAAFKIQNASVILIALPIL
jgi:hypothetical protein